MRLLSIQAGTPKTIAYKGRDVLTSFFKTPIASPVLVKTFNISGDLQSDLNVHGGRDKAVYAYSADAYAFWNERYDNIHPYGSLGENLTFNVLNENKILLGDIYQLGDCQLQVSQSRFPCFKLALRFNDPSAVNAFHQLCRPGVYFRVLKEGLINTGEDLKLIERSDDAMSVTDDYRIRMEKQ